MKRKAHKILAILLAFCMVASYGFAFESNFAYAAKKTKKVKVTSITLNHKVYTVKKGKKLKLKAAIEPAKAKKKATIVWKTSSKKLATVSKKGIVKVTKKKQKKAKKVKITATVKGTKKKAVCVVWIGTPVKQTVFAESSLKLKTGDTASAGASVSPANATVKTITYTSNNEAVATVDGNGQIKAVSAGTAVITATPVDEAGKASTMTVTVEDPVAPTVSVTGVKLSAAEKTLEKGESFTLTATVEPSNATNKEVTFASSDNKVVTVDASGKVTAVDAGTANVTVKTADGGKTAVCKVTVKKPVIAVTGVKLNAAEKTLEKGETFALTATVEPTDATNKEVTFTSSDNKVVTVDASGKVTAVDAGTANVTVKTADGGKTAVCIVTVKKPVIAVTGVKLNAAEKTLEQGESFTLTAAIEPSDATNKEVTFASSDNKVVTVDANGKVTAVRKGTADITVTTADGGKTAVCKITVTFPKELVVDKAEAITQEIIDAVKSGEIKKLLIKTDNNVNLEIPKEDLRNASLIVDAPKGHIENNAKFNDVLVKAVSNSTYVEHAQGNTITFLADNGKLEVAEDASAEVIVGDGVNGMDIIADGNISKLTLDTKANINIDGATKNSIPTEMTENAADSRVSTSVDLDINTAAKATLNIRSGAEHTTVSAVNEAATPEITGLGVINVQYEDPNVEECSIVAKNEDIPADTIKVTVNGITVKSDGSAESGVGIFLIPYKEELSNEQVAANADSSAKYTTESGSDGAYSISNVIAGNYYLAAKKNGFVAAVGKVIIEGNSSKVFSVQDMVMISGSDKDKKGKLSGRLVDAVTGDPVVSGLTVKIRTGTNNVSGDVIETVYTNNDGEYYFNKALPYGQYTVQVLDQRNDDKLIYASTSFNVSLSSDEQKVKDESLTARVSPGQVRFVLSWGKEESGASSDLDSHLVGPAINGEGQFHTWYGDRNYYLDGDHEDEEDDGALDYDKLVADLDRDDTDWEGPETTTIRIKSPGIYSFYIHDYSNGTDNSSTQMARSGAVVNVYVGSKTYGPYNMPNRAGVLWYVCDYDSNTGKVIPKNEIVEWHGETDEIGLNEEEILRRATKRLQTLIDEAQSIVNSLPSGDLKTEGLGLIKDANAAISAADQTKIYASYEALDSWISSIKEAFNIESVYTGDDLDDNLILSWDTEEIWDDNEETLLYRVLYIYGETEESPSDITIDFTNSNVQREIKNSDRSGFDKMLVASYAGLTRTYYITYKQDENYILGIDGVSAMIPATSEDDEESDQITKWNWYVGDEDGNYFTLDIQGITESIPAELEITPRHSDASVEIKDSDKDGYEKMAVVTNGNKSRTYYITYSLDKNYVLGIDSVSAIIPATSEEDDDHDQITDWDWDYGDEEEDYFTLAIQGETESIPAELEITPRHSDSSVEIKDSDKDSYEKMAVVTFGSMSRTYYITYRQDENYLLGIDKVSAVIPAASAEDDDHEQITNWYWSSDYDDNDNKIYTLNVSGETKSLPAEISIEAKFSETTVTIKASDKDGYEKMAVVTNGSKSRTYYISYSQDENYMFGISKVSAVIPAASDDEDDHDQITNWYLSSDYDDDDDTTYIIEVRGETESLPTEFSIEAALSETTVTIKDSDKGGYEKMAVMTNGSKSRNYYISYSQDESNLFVISNVSAVIPAASEDEDDHDQITYWNSYSDYEDDGYPTYIIEVRGETESLPAEFSVEAALSETTVVIKDSDWDGYEKMAVMTNGSKSRTYYISYSQDEYCRKIAERFNNAEDLGVISVFDITDIDVPAYGIAYKFSPEADGTYQLWANSNADSFGELYDINRTLIASDDDGYENSDFMITYDMQAGETYYIVIRGYSIENEFTSGLHIAPYSDPSEEGFLDVSDAYGILNEFRTNADNQWYWNEDDTEQITTGELSELEYDENLEEVAKVRAEEAWIQCYENGNPTHDRLDGSDCFTAYPDTLTSRGENLAWGQESSYDAIADPEKGWAETNESYAGQGHRRNMLSSDFTHVGIACYTKNGQTCWAMCLGSY